MRKFKLSLGSTIHFCVSTSLFTFVPLQPVECDLWSIIWWGLMKNNQPLLETITIFVIESLWILNNPYIGTSYAIILIVVIELRRGVQFGLKSYAWFQNHKYDFRPKLHYTKFNYHFITSILKSLIFLNLYWSTRLVCKKLTWKRVYMYMWTKQNDRCHFTKTHWSAKETRVNFIHANVQAWVLKSCYCKKLIAFFKV